MTADGSPGASRIVTNAMIVTSHSTNARESRREVRKRVIYAAPPSPGSALVLAPDVPEARRGVEGGKTLQAVPERVEAEEIAVLDQRDVLVDIVLDLLVELQACLAIALEQRLLQEGVDLLARVGLVAGVRLQHEREAARVGADREGVGGDVPVAALL